MKKLLKITLKIILALAAVALLAALCVGVWILAYSARDRRVFAQAQREHVAAMEALYGAPDFAPVSERDMTGFDAAAAIDSGPHLNDIRFIGTHNSYKAYNPSAERLMQAFIAPLRLAHPLEWSYGFERLSAQLDHGIRSLELDVMREKDGFRCAHIPVIDYASNCPDFGLALEEIALWSDAHPGHLPITVLVEAKGRLRLEDVLRLDALVAGKLGERLYTPAEMLGGYADFGQLRGMNGYPLLSAVLGKIIVIYHYHDETTAAYADHDPSLRSHKMFLSALHRYSRSEESNAMSDANQSYVCFGIDHWPDGELLEQNAREHNILMRTTCDSYPWHDAEYDAASLACAAFILSTDYPPRGEPGEDPHVFAFQGGATAAYSNTIESEN